VEVLVEIRPLIVAREMGIIGQEITDEQIFANLNLGFHSERVH